MVKKERADNVDWDPFNDQLLLLRFPGIAQYHDMERGHYIQNGTGKKSERGYIR
jgi:hypothetical protein